MPKKDPWTDPDPQPGDFDEYLATVDPDDVEEVEAGSDVKLIFIGDKDPDDWVRRQQATRAER